MTCTFFGHRDYIKGIKPILKNTLLDLIVNKNVDCFLVGNNGFFDSSVISVLTELQNEYLNINFFVVLAYMPLNSMSFENTSYKTLFPEGLESVPHKFAISYRNNWMLKKSDYVVAFVKRPFGGAAKFYNMALRQNKKVINLADL